MFESLKKKIIDKIREYKRICQNLTCGESVVPWDACNYLTACFKAGRMDAKEIKRGLMEATSKEAVNL
jgi:S-adenosylmethionine/arginine decarboxylase-like enzyme